MKADILNRAWKYTPSSQTDIRKTFAKARRELADKKILDQRLAAISNVRQINRG